jgi:hypothetical protein
MGLKSKRRMQLIYFKQVMQIRFAKKNVAKIFRFSYFQRQSHHAVPGQTVCCPVEKAQNTETLTNNIGGTR